MNEPAAQPRAANGPAAQPLTWKLRVTGLDWLLSLIGGAPGQISIADLLKLAATQGQKADTSTPVPFGIEASLHWATDVFKDVDLGPVKFKQTADTRMQIDAQASVNLGLEGLTPDLSALTIDPAKARLSSRASFENFSVLLFESIEVVFTGVTFTLTPDGRKEFSINLADVRLSGALSFINQLSKVLGGLGGDSGIDIDISPARVKIGQTLKFPPKEGDQLFIGPAQITNLALGWGVMIPLIGRDVLTVSFAISSREKPLTIFVPPWYGGKAHALIEVTTRGVRLLEISLEFGALIPIHWGIASGEASLMAGIFYMMERTPSSGKVVFKAFVSAQANLDVASIIHFAGLVYIALTYTEVDNRRLVAGEATVSVSIKIAFVRYSYSFSATHVEESRSGAQAARAAAPLSVNDPKAAPDDFAPSLPDGPPGDIRLFGPGFNTQRREAFERILNGYLA